MFLISGQLCHSDTPIAESSRKYGPELIENTAESDGAERALQENELMK
jgi:hypothetical protein